jgi:hypothetical protein
MRLQLGDDLPIRVQVRNQNKQPVLPDAAPSLRVYDEAGTLAVATRLPPFGSALGMFGSDIPLDASFAEGAYSWRATWTVGNIAGVASGQFRIVPGGDPAGPVLAQDFIDKRGATHLLQQLAGDEYAFGTNPSL